MNDFYENHHKKYFESTVSSDPASFLEPFVKFLSPLATILDIGCGSGRDLLWFSQHGFKPTGFEQSPSLVQLAGEFSQCIVIEGDFSIYDFSKLQFDALSFVGSLVHLPKEDLPKVLASVCRALFSGGFIFITMKEGIGTFTGNDGRVFTLWSQKDLNKIFADQLLQILDFSRQPSKIRSDDVWLGYVLRMRDTIYPT